MFRGSRLGRGMSILLFPAGRCGSAGVEVEAVVSDFKDVPTMGKPIQQDGNHLGVAEHGGPFAEAEIGGNDDAGPLVELAQEMEEQGAA